MKQIIIKSIFIPLIFILSNCGYKVLNNVETNNLSIKEINTLGDKRINFRIKNNLAIYSTKNSKNNAILTLETKKTKKIKEKNIKNEITKYEISLISSVKIDFLEKIQKYEFSVSSTGDYSVDGKYSTTLQNEKRLIEDLTNDLSDKIINKINLITNDY